MDAAAVRSQVRLSERPPALHHPRAGRTVTVMGQLHQARQEAVVRQLVFTIEGVCGRRRGRQPGQTRWTQFTSIVTVYKRATHRCQCCLYPEPPGRGRGCPCRRSCTRGKVNGFSTNYRPRLSARFPATDGSIIFSNYDRLNKRRPVLLTFAV